MVRIDPYHFDFKRLILELQKYHFILSLLFITASCTCKDLINVGGYGNCKGSRDFNRDNKLTCYVNQPSTCTDLVDSFTNPGEKSSTEPCYQNRQLLKYKELENSNKGGKY